MYIEISLYNANLEYFLLVIVFKMSTKLHMIRFLSSGQSEVGRLDTLHLVFSAWPRFGFHNDLDSYTKHKPDSVNERYHICRRSSRMTSGSLFVLNMYGGLRRLRR